MDWANVFGCFLASCIFVATNPPAEGFVPQKSTCLCFDTGERYSQLVSITELYGQKNNSMQSEAYSRRA